MVLYDATIGAALYNFQLCFLVYYVVWILITPYIDDSQPIHMLFPRRQYGIIFAAIMVAIVFGGTLSIAAIHIIRRNRYYAAQRAAGGAGGGVPAAAAAAGVAPPALPPTPPQTK